MPELNMEDIPYSELSHEERPYRCAQIVALTKAEIPKEKIETLEDITNRWWKTASYRDSPRSGRPQILSKRDKDELACGVRTGKYNNAMKAAAAFNHGPQRDVSAETVHLLLLKSGANCVTQTGGNRFCCLRLGKGVTNGQRSICTGGRRTGCGSSTPTNRNSSVLGQDMLQRSMENEFIPRMHSVGGSIFVFGGMCWWGATKLARSQVPTVDKFVMHDFVEDFLLPKLREFREADINLTIQHDNDAKLHAPNWEEFYEREGYRVLPWPAYSPDMNPIEDS
ncbi:hypothetical protein SAICODRAFT_30661 [Saitoella complicata NRRL Y-17804]|uniref:uncharacterized protein n=1 Tax=Saitoella complicata (strain BCRC 22490 / CBS 7301 / JCM 7358 / NBRC 10748 / NRRL Y-17804) TaxID=698492 RepID=UPI0008678BB8|nr:uncharacterized protein SAICODRAFT_30661 [Saitoella complicata NRRL Y-17804]ODQ52529.1 hypothetical protein SAICODRAFT_30661 [Saitoella complicata NRRL Y-17804]